MSGAEMITTNLVGISLHTAGLLATVGHAGAGEVGCVAHVHRHPLVDRLRLDDDLPVSWEQNIHQSVRKISGKNPTFGVAGETRLKEI